MEEQSRAKSRAVRLVLSFAALLWLAACSAPAVSPPTVPVYAHQIKVKGGDCASTAVGPSTLLTAAHCISGPTPLEVDGKAANILWVALDGNDHALVGIDLHFASWATQLSSPAVGSRVYFIGNPHGEGRLYRSGYVAGADRKGRALYDIHAFFGDSGSGIFNERGELVGVLTQIFSLTAGDVSEWFAASQPLSFTAQQWQLIQ